jgi:hypothetical protein
MALGRKTGGRKVGTPNKIRAPKFKERILQAHEEALARVEVVTKQTPLEFLLLIMRDESYPPGARIECAKAALPFCHAKMAEQPTEQPVQITRIERVIIRPGSDHDISDHQDEVPRQVVEPGAVHSTLPAEQEPGDRQWPADEPDAVARAPARLDKMRH